MNSGGNVGMLSQEEKIEYVSGKGMWHTNDLKGKMPQIQLSDGPHGLRAQAEGKMHNNDSQVATCFPTASASACSFDPQLIGRMAVAIAEEAKEQGVSVVLGPGVNVKRSPLCGRNFEYFSEDPYLAGVLSTAYVAAMQRQGVGTSLKHFAGNSQETCRMTMNAQIDERALREIYLPAFERCIKEAKPATVMASYNRLNGVHSCENRHLLQEILRDEWGYDGCVISDWGACVDLPACIEAGMDLEMPDSLGNHRPAMREALEKGRLSPKALDRAVEHITSLVENYPPLPTQKRREDHHLLAKQIAKESAVLLKNNGVLPFSQHEKILVIGSMAEEVRIQGGGSSHIQTGPYLNILEAFQSMGVDVVYAKGYPQDRTTSIAQWERETLVQVKRAKAEQRKIVFCGGLTNVTEGEGYDRTTYDMPKNQQQLLNQVCALHDEVVFLSFGGAPYDMGAATGTQAVLMMYLGGEAVAEAAVELLLGKANPCGKLAETWPLCLEDTPCYEQFARRAPRLQDVEYRESIYVGYRYYETFDVPVRYEFGYGLSYTSFDYRDLQIIKGDDGCYGVSCKVSNTGSLFGKEVVQLYLMNPQTDLMRAGKELRGFQKVALAPGETTEVRFALTERDFSVFDIPRNAFVCVAGTYQVCVGASVKDIRLQAPIAIPGQTMPGNQRKTLPSYFPGRAERFAPTREDFGKLYGRPFSDYTDTKKGEFSMKNSLRQLAEVSMEAKILFSLAKGVGHLFMFGKPKDDPEVMMMIEGICDGNLDSVVNQSGGILKYRWMKRLIEKANR